MDSVRKLINVHWRHGSTIALELWNTSKCETTPVALSTRSGGPPPTQKENVSSEAVRGVGDHPEEADSQGVPSMSPRQSDTAHKMAV